METTRRQNLRSAEDYLLERRIQMAQMSGVIESFTLRDIQSQVMEEIDNHDDKKFIAMQLPTGSGKSLLSQLLAKKYAVMYPQSSIDIITCTKNLQEQYMKTFPYLNNVMGKANYTCDSCGDTCEVGKLINKQKGKVCDSCPYDFAVDMWRNGFLNLTNFHMFITFCLYLTDIMPVKNPNVLIIDEAHDFSKVMSDFVSFRISKYYWKHAPKAKAAGWEKFLSATNDPQQLRNWIKDIYMPSMTSIVKDIGKEAVAVKGKKKKNDLYNDIKSVENHIASLNNFIDMYSKAEWVIDRGVNSRDEKYTEIQPVWCGEIINEKIFSYYDKVIFMSGSLNYKMLCTTNGISESETAFIDKKFIIPKERRPIYYFPVGKMTYHTKETVWNDYIPYIQKGLKKYRGKKGIIHSGNYQLSDWLQRDVHDERLLFVNPENKQRMLDKHFNSPDDTVIVSPSLMTGLDLPDDLSRFQFILKMPYPNLGSMINKVRNEKNKRWYAMETIKELLQGYGRSNRSEEDWSDTLIFDRCFTDLLIQNEDLFPEYFTEAIIRIKKK